MMVTHCQYLDRITWTHNWDDVMKLGFMVQTLHQPRQIYELRIHFFLHNKLQPKIPGNNPSNFENYGNWL